MTVSLIEREITKAELEHMQAGFEAYMRESGVPSDPGKRHTFVTEADGDFVGCASGLTYHHWFYLTDLWLEKPYRGMGFGKLLLQNLESRLIAEGIKYIYTWTADFEAPEFYKRQGYEVFVKLENYYPAGHSRVGLRKTLEAL